MSKRPSEGSFGKALRDVDLSMYVYRPPDPKSGEGVSNWKPCDFMVWTRSVDGVSLSWDASGLVKAGAASMTGIAVSAWFECKDTDAVNAFPFADIRPSQLAGIRDAARLGIPYWLAIWWRRHRSWTVSDGWRMLNWKRDQELEGSESHGTTVAVTSIDRTLLMSRFGLETTQAQLTSNLKAILLGEAD